MMKKQWLGWMVLSVVVLTGATAVYNSQTFQDLAVKGTLTADSITPAGGTLTVDGVLRTGGGTGIISDSDEYYFDGDSSYIGIAGGLLGYYNSGNTLQGMQGSKFVAPLVESGGTNLLLDPNSAGAGKISYGVAGDGDTHEFNGDIVKTLQAATGNEYALNLEYTTNKTTSGDDVGIRINQTDTASPGTSYLAWFGVGGTVKAYIQNNGAIFGEVIGSNSLVSKTNNNTLLFQYRDFTAADNAVEAATGTVTNSSGQFNGFVVKPTYNQTGTAAGTDLLINRTQTAVGSGAQRLMDLQVGSDSKMWVTNTGVMHLKPIAEPGSAVEGDMYMDSTSHKLRVYTGSAWQDCW